MLGVEGVLELGHRLGGILDPEERDPFAAAQVAVAAEVGDQGIVGVQDEAGRALARGDHLGPFVGEPLELAVAIELVAEEVAEHEQGGGELVDDLRQPRLVDLEQPLRRRCCSSSAVATPQAMFEPGAVVDRVPAGRVECGGEHPGGRRLAVRGADHGRAAPLSLPPSRPIASGAVRRRTRPGSVVPPPRPDRRLSDPIARAPATLTPKSREPLDGGGPSRGLGRDQLERVGQNRDPGRQLGDPIAVGVDVERPVRLDLDDPAAPDGHLVVLRRARP